MNRCSRDGGFELARCSCADAWADQGEAEYIEMVGGAAKETATRNLVGEMEMPMKLVVENDSEAGMEFCARFGVGKIRPMVVKYLWLLVKGLDFQDRYELASRMLVTLITARGKTGSAAPADSSCSISSIASIAMCGDDVAFIGYKL